MTRRAPDLPEPSPSKRSRWDPGQPQWGEGVHPDSMSQGHPLRNTLPSYPEDRSSDWDSDPDWDRHGEHQFHHRQPSSARTASPEPDEHRDPQAKAQVLETLAPYCTHIVQTHS